MLYFNSQLKYSNLKIYDKNKVLNLVYLNSNELSLRVLKKSILC